jgi:hypothetical protein
LGSCYVFSLVVGFLGPNILDESKSLKHVKHYFTIIPGLKLCVHVVFIVAYIALKWQFDVR